MTDIARAENPTPIVEGDIYKACKAFILAYALPALDPAHVIQGWQNRAALPPATNEYAVMSILYDKQHGSTVMLTDRDSGLTAIKGLIEVAVQIDFCSDDDTARQRTRRLAIVTSSCAGVHFFHDYGLSALYADDARDISFVGDAKQFVRRWMTTLHLTLIEGVVVDFGYFDHVEMNRVENVNVHHKP